MLTFLSVALLLFGAMHVYAFSKVWGALPQSSALGLALTLAAIGLTFSPLLVWFLDDQGRDPGIVAATTWVSYAWMGYLFLFVCIAALFDLGHALGTLLSVKWPLNEAMTLRAVALLALVMAGYGAIEARQLQIEEVHITTPKLASGHITIAQISDVHFGTLRAQERLERIVNKLGEIKPDIVVATGDIVDRHADSLAALAQGLRSCAPPLGAYAVTGNHERHAGLEGSLRFLRDAGFTVLRGESVKVGGIVLAGVDDAGGPAPPGQHAGLPSATALAPATVADFVVLLKHQPVVDGSTPFDLQLSGHIHGGQMFPFVYLTWLAYGVHPGLTRLADGRQLYVSRGAGTWGPPLRLFAAPEITRITIASSK